MMQLPLHVTCSCIAMHTYFLFINIDIFLLLRTFLIFSFFLSLSFVCVSLLPWHSNASLLYPETLFVSGHPLLLVLLPFTSNSMMRRPKRTSLRTFLDEAFIQNAKSFCRTSLTLTYPLSFTIRVGSHCVTS